MMSLKSSFIIMINTRLTAACVCVQEYNQNSIFSQAYGKNLPPSSKPDAPMVHQETSLYTLFEGTPWSPSLPASSGTSQRCD